jgi:hypothetical protein
MGHEAAMIGSKEYPIIRLQKMKEKQERIRISCMLNEIPTRQKEHLQNLTGLQTTHLDYLATLLKL